MESQTAAQPKAICPSNFFKVGGIKSGHTVFITTSDIIYTSHLRGWCIAGILTFLYANLGISPALLGHFYGQSLAVSSAQSQQINVKLCQPVWAWY